MISLSHAGGENRAVILLQLLAQLGGGWSGCRCGAMAICPRLPVPGQRLGVAQMGGAGGSNSACGPTAMEPTQPVENLPVENLRHQPHALVYRGIAPVAGDDAGAILAAGVAGRKARNRSIGRVGMAENAEHAAVMFWMVEARIQKNSLGRIWEKFKGQAHFFG